MRGVGEMCISVNLYSRYAGEINIFLERFYEKELKIDKDLNQWVHICNKPLEVVDIISALIDNEDVYSIVMYIQVGNGDFQPVTSENYNYIIEALFCVYYENN